MYTLEEYRESLNGKRSSHERAATVELIRQSAVAAEKLTGQPEWDRFLSYLQAIVEQATQSKVETLDMLCDARLVNHDEIMFLKMRLAELNNTINIIKQIQQLPSQIQQLDKDQPSR